MKKKILITNRYQFGKEILLHVGKKLIKFFIASYANLGHTDRSFGTQRTGYMGNLVNGRTDVNLTD